MSLATDLGSDLGAALSPEVFAQRCGLTLDPWQRAAVSSTARSQLWNVTRQGGKDLTAGLAAAHQAAYSPGSTTLILAPSQRQSVETLAVARALLRHLGRPEAESESRVKLANGARIVAVPGGEGGHSIRGFTISLLVCNEASRISDEVYAAARPMLATTGGRLLALSTPHGRRGWWAEAWFDGGSLWERTLISAEQCPRISAEFLAEERASLGDWLFRQEYFGEFVGASDSVFSADDLQAAFGGRVLA